MKLTDLNTLLIDASFKKDLSTGVWANGSQIFAYNDGDEAENYILDSVRNTQDVSLASEELAKYIKDWASLYHFSQRRSNLLAPFKSWFNGKRILEIGCGCGAISRFLGEAGAQVVSVEGSLRRATIARARCKDLENVEIICAPSNTLPDLGEFDAVLLIGVLEYARCFLGKDGQKIMLQDCHKRLTKDGHIFVAIENKLGIKYFAGALEDHVGIPMHGINSAYTADSVATFGRIELKELLSDSGFKAVEEYLPLPDYKLPCTLVTPLGWQKYSTELSTLALESVFQDPQGVQDPTFSVEQGIKNIWENELASDLSNSFLMIATKGQPIDLHGDIAAYHYSDGRKPQYQKFLMIREDKQNENNLFVDSQKMFPDLIISNDAFLQQQIIKKTVFIHGDSLFVELIKIVNTENWSSDHVASWLIKWLDALVIESGVNQPISLESKLAGLYSDATAFNAIQTNHGIKFFDLEWQENKEVELGYVVYRNLLHSFCRITSFAPFREASETSLIELIKLIMYRAGLILSEDKRLYYESVDFELSALISLRFDKKTSLEIFKNKSFSGRPTLAKQRNYIEMTKNKIDSQSREIEEKSNHIINIENQIKAKDNCIENQYNELKAKQSCIDDNKLQIDMQLKEWQRLCNQVDSLASELQSVYRSKSWKVTKPIRFLSVKLKRISPLLLHPVLLGKFFYIKLNKTFDNEKYLLANPDVRAAGGNPLVHYLRYGKNEQRSLSPVLTDNLIVHQIDSPYNDWIKQNDTYDIFKIGLMRHHISKMKHQPLISIVMPTYNTPDWALKAAIDSVLNQVYPHWELCIADDASKQAHVKEILMSYAQLDSRIKVEYRAENGHISLASNSALNLVTGEFIALLDHDDVLPINALYEVALAINANPEAKMFYSDEDKINEQGSRCDPYFKSDWNPDLFLAQNMFNHLGVYQTDLVQKVGGFRQGVEGSQDYDLALRCLEVVGHKVVHHIPKILYHWRMLPGSAAVAVDEKPYTTNAALKAIQEYLDRQKIKATVDEIKPKLGYYRVKYALPEILPKVSIIIPTRDGKALVEQCIESILNKTTYSNYEILLVDNGSTDAEALAYFALLNEKPQIRVIRDDSPFNYSALNNNAVKQSSGEIICLLNNDIEVITPDWLDEMVSHALRPEIGVVGARLWYPNDHLQHGGVILGFGGIAGHVFHNLTRSEGGYFAKAWLPQNYSAVTAACLVVRKSVYKEVNGLEEQLSVAFNDVDFCIRVRDAGYRNLWTPFAELYHHESATRGSDQTTDKIERFHKEIAFLIERYGESLQKDPFYNINLDLYKPYQLALFIRS